MKYWKLLIVSNEIQSFTIANAFDSSFESTKSSQKGFLLKGHLKFMIKPAMKQLQRNLHNFLT